MRLLLVAGYEVCGYSSAGGKEKGPRKIALVIDLALDTSLGSALVSSPIRKELLTGIGRTPRKGARGTRL
jgi:hypothetical protein